MRTDISTELIAAGRGFIRTPLIQARCYRPGYAGTYVEISRYLNQMDLRVSLNIAPATLTLTCGNPNNVLSSHPLIKTDYVIDLYLGYATRYRHELVQYGRYYTDAPQHEFSVSPPKNQLILQARDGWKLFAERNFTVDEQVDLSDIAVGDAIEQCCAFVTVAGTPVTVVFDTDADTVAALGISTVGVIAGPQDSTHDAYALISDILTVSGLQAQWQYDGTLRIGMMAQTTSVMTFGGVGVLRRPVWQRQHRRSNRAVYNWVHVEGDRVFADASSPDNIVDIGRTKYFYVDDPTLSTTGQAELRASQMLLLSQRFIDQPDFITSWMLDLERRDVITLDDEAATGLAAGDYRVETLAVTFQGGAAPKEEMTVGLGLPNVADEELVSGDFATGDV